MGRVPKSPRRRTYKTGGELPALTTDFRPIPLGRDSQGEPDSQIRALAVLIRNRSDSPVYIREGPDSGDSFEISRGEDYKIWEPNGVADISLKGTNGGETVEVRALEAHNDFDITDKIEAFARSIAHFVGTATTNTTITGQEVDVSIDDAGGISVVGDVDANLTGSDVDIPVTGDVNANIVNATLDVDASGSTVTAQIANSVLNIDGDVDITGQNNFDLQVFDRQGYQNVRFLSESGVQLTFDSGITGYVWDTHTWNIYDPAAFAGEVVAMRYSINNPDADASGSIHYYGPRLEIDRGNTGNYEQVSSAYASTPQNAAETRQPNVEIGFYEPRERVDMTVVFPDGIRFEAGDSVRVRTQGDGTTPSAVATADIQIELTLRERNRVEP